MGRELGKWDKVQGLDSRKCKLIKMINYIFWAKQVGVDPPPQGERPKCYSRLDMIPGDVSSRKCWNDVWRSVVKTRKIHGPQKKRKS